MWPAGIRQTIFEWTAGGGQRGVTGQYHGHVFRSIPGAVVIGELGARGLGHDFLIADGQAVREPRAGKEIRPHLVAEALGGVFSAPGFLQNHSAFLVQFLGQQRHAEGVITEHHQSLVHLFRLGVGRVEHVHRLVKAGKGVQVATKLHADAFKVRDQFARGKCSVPLKAI